jgi:hypothetical protein
MAQGGLELAIDLDCAVPAGSAWCRNDQLLTETALIRSSAALSRGAQRRHCLRMERPPRPVPLPCSRRDPGELAHHDAELRHLLDRVRKRSGNGDFTTTAS